MKSRFNFQALDIVHFWADAKNLLVSIANKEISVTCKTNLSKEAVKVCNFISLVVGRTWTFRTVRTGDDYTFFFQEFHNVVVPTKTNKKKVKKKPEQKTKTLFD